eukprot:2164049-Pyramimonas_sp.AAC.1
MGGGVKQTAVINEPNSQQYAPPVTYAMKKAEALGDVCNCVARKGFTRLADSYRVTSARLFGEMLTRAHMCE